MGLGPGPAAAAGLTPEPPHCPAPGSFSTAPLGSAGARSAVPAAAAQPHGAALGDWWESLPAPALRNSTARAESMDSLSPRCSRVLSPRLPNRQGCASLPWDSCLVALAACQGFGDKFYQECLSLSAPVREQD